MTKRRWLSYYLLLPLVLVLLTLSAATLWLVNTEAGARWALATALRQAAPQTEIGNIRGTISRGLTVTGLYVPLAGAEVRIGELEGQWSLWNLLGGQINVDRLHFETVDITLTKGPVDNPPPPPSPWPRLALGFPLSIEDLAINHFKLAAKDQVFEVDQLTLQVVASPLHLHIHRLAASSGPLQLAIRGRIGATFPYAADLKMDWRHHGDSGDYQGASTLQGSLKKLTIEHQLLQPFQVETSIDLAVDPQGPPSTIGLDTLSFSASNHWRNLVLTLDGIQVHSQGNLAMDGRPSAYRLTGESQLTLDQPTTGVADAHDNWQATLAEFSASPIGVALAASGNLEGLEFETFNIDAKERGSMASSGTLRWNEGLQWSLSVQANHLDVGVFFPLFPARLDADLDSAGRWREGQLSADVTIGTLQGDLYGRPVHGSGALQIANHRLQINQLDLRAGDNQLQIQGTLAEDSDLSWQLAAEDLSLIVPGWTGRAQSQGRIKGAFTNVQIDTETEVSGLTAGDWRAKHLRLQAVTEEPGRYGLVIVGKGLRGPGLAHAELRIDGEGTISDHELTGQLDDGAQSVGLHLIGGYQSNQWRGFLSQLEIRSLVAGTWLQQGQTEIELSRTKQSLTPLCVEQNEAELCLNLTKEAEKLLGEAQLVGLDLGHITPWLPQGSTLTGRLGGELRLTGSYPKLDGRFFLKTTDAVLSHSLDSTAPIQYPLSIKADGTLDKGELAAAMAIDIVDTAALELALNTSAANVDAPLGGYLHGTIHSLDWLGAVTEDMEDPQGRLDIHFDLSGSRKQPRAKGSLALADFSATLPSTGIQLTEGRGVFHLESEGPWRAEAQVSSGDGTLHLVGDGHLGAQATDHRVRITGQRVRLFDLHDLEAVISPDVEVTLAKGRIGVTGVLEVPSARLLAPNLPDTAVTVSEDEILASTSPEEESQATRVNLDLKLSFGDDVRFEGYGLTTGLGGKLRLSQTDGSSLQAHGTVRLRQATYEAYGQELKVDKGSLLFQGAVDNPGLNLVALRELPGIKVGLRIGGFAQDVRSDIFSQPALPPTEALTILVTGKPLTAIDQTAANQVANAATALGISHSDAITGRLQSAFGFDVLSLGNGNGYLDSSLVVGKYLSPRLFISYVQNLFAPEGSVALRYRLGDHMELEATSGAAQSVDLRYHIEH